MSSSLQVVLACSYSLVLLVVAWLLDVLGRHGARMSRESKTTNFIYLDDRDGWKCHEDHWLWPASFDPQKRVVRYRGQHEICGRCPIKDTCSPTMSAREVTMPVDPWPYSEAGLFHRGMTVCVMVAALALPVGMFFVARSVAEVLALVVTIAIVGLALVPTAASMRHRPVDIPEGLPLEASVSDAGTTHDDGRVRVLGVHGQATTDRAGDEADRLIARYGARWRSDRTRYRSVEQAAVAEAEARSAFDRRRYYRGTDDVDAGRSRT